MPLPLYPYERILLLTEQHTVWAPELVWMVLERRKSLAQAGIQNPHCPICSSMLQWPRYPGSRLMKCDGQKWKKKFSRNHSGQNSLFNVDIMHKSWTWSHQNTPRYITMWPRVRVKNSTITTCPVLHRTAKETFVKYIQAIRISRNTSPAIFFRFNTEIFTLKYSKCNNYIYYFSKLYDSRQKHKK